MKALGLLGTWTVSEGCPRRVLEEEGEAAEEETHRILTRLLSFRLLEYNV